jgi:pimeloyl-ACP methyl ester carboxylesterase
LEKNMKGCIVVLVHGFNKNCNDMRYLEAALTVAGYSAYSANLPTTFGSLDEAAQSLYFQIKDIVNEAESVCYVAHSMGGLIVRRYIRTQAQCNVEKCVFIATPHGGSRLAKVADTIPGYSAIFKPIIDLLPNAGYDLLDKSREFRVGIIAGNKSEGVLGKLFLNGESDGRVEIDSAKAGDADEFVVVPFGHKDIHHREETASLVIKFIKMGSFFGS